MSRIAMVIPSRLGSTRLPRKALLDIAGLPMVVRVAKQAAATAPLLPAGWDFQADQDLFVATDSEEIASVVNNAGYKAIMTPAELNSGTDRVAYVAKNLSHEIIVNVQGDEPVVSPKAIAAAIASIASGQGKMGSVMTKFSDPNEFAQRSCVKVLTNKNSQAIYFSRAQIPFRQGEQPWDTISGETHIGKHLGIYAFERNFLQTFTRLEPSYLEKLESLEQLRALYHGYAIQMGFSEEGSIGVDTADDLEKVRSLFSGK